MSPEQLVVVARAHKMERLLLFFSVVCLMGTVALSVFGEGGTYWTGALFLCAVLLLSKARKNKALLAEMKARGLPD